MPKQLAANKKLGDELLVKLKAGDDGVAAADSVLTQKTNEVGTARSGWFAGYKGLSRATIRRRTAG